MKFTRFNKLQIVFSAVQAEDNSVNAVVSLIEVSVGLRGELTCRQ